MENLLTLTSEVLPPDAHVVSFRGSEGLSRLYQFEIGLMIKDSSFELDDAIRGRAVLTVHTGEGKPYCFHGILAGIDHLHEREGKALFRAVLVPQLWDLTQTFHSRVFTDNTVPEIIQAVLEHNGLTSDSFAFHLNETYAKHEHICQYKESSFAFISRWMEREGMYYFFEHGDGCEKLIICDHLSFHDALTETPVRYVPLSADDAMATQALDSFICRRTALPATVKMVDYDFMNPKLDVSGSVPVALDGQGEIQIYGKNITTPEDSKRLAGLRSEALLATAKVFHGRGRAFYLRSGYTFGLDEHPRVAFNADYLVTELEHYGNQSGGDDHFHKLLGVDDDEYGQDEYGVSVTAIPADVQYRPPETTHWPRIDGFETATICGEQKSTYAQIDDDGRYKILIKFDESDLVDGSASTWVRMMQPHAGGNEGFHFPLRKGTEVLLAFLGGDPDRPVIAGAVPNALTPSPVTGANHTLNVIQTGGNNRIEMKDDDGGQHIKLSSPVMKSFIHLGAKNPPFNMRLQTEGSIMLKCDLGHSQEIIGLKHEEVTGGKIQIIKNGVFGGNYFLSIEGDQSIHAIGNVDLRYDKKCVNIIGKDHKVTVGGKQEELIKGNLTQVCNGNVVNTYKGTLKTTVTKDAEYKYKGKHKVEIKGDWKEIGRAKVLKINYGTTSETFIGRKNANLIGGEVAVFAGAKAEIVAAATTKVHKGIVLESVPENRIVKVKSSLEAQDTVIKKSDKFLAKWGKRLTKATLWVYK